MTQKAKNIVASFPQLSLAELWVIIEAAQAEIRMQTVHPEPVDKQTLLSNLDRRYKEIVSGKAKLISGDMFDEELKKTE